MVLVSIMNVRCVDVPFVIAMDRPAVAGVFQVSSEA
jgi:hypothetical protein